MPARDSRKIVGDVWLVWRFGIAVGLACHQRQWRFYLAHVGRLSSCSVQGPVTHVAAALVACRGAHVSRARPRFFLVLARGVKSCREWPFARLFARLHRTGCRMLYGPISCLLSSSNINGKFHSHSHPANFTGEGDKWLLRSLLHCRMQINANPSRERHDE